jgi:hypothetical protein
VPDDELAVGPGDCGRGTERDAGQRCGCRSEESLSA